MGALAAVGAGKTAREGATHVSRIYFQRHLLLIVLHHNTRTTHGHCTMDWTGGTRRRYAQGKRNAVVQKQKEHFAKIRSAQREQLDWLEHGIGALASIEHRPVMFSFQPAHTGYRVSKSRRRSAGYGRPSKAPTRDSASAVEAAHGPRSSNASRSRPGVSDEKRLLLANRQRLLARSDWLGLAASCPARIKFPATSDRDRVGKRRKISKAKPRSHKARPARRGSVTPIFEHRLPPFEPMMSGAMLEIDDEIKVKIGTDAFVSQSQISRPTQASENTSMCQPSTNFGPLSEESMLLGADDDGFEIDANGQYIGEIGRAKTLVSESEHSKFRSKDQARDDFSTPSKSIAPTFATTNRGEVIDRHNEKAEDSLVQPYSMIVHDDVSIRSNEAYGRVDARMLDSTKTFDHTNLPYDNGRSISSTRLDPEENERRWRRVMRIPEAASSSNTSIAALRSSSQHVAESAWPVHIDHQVSEQVQDHRTVTTKYRVPLVMNGPRPVPADDAARLHPPLDKSMPLFVPSTRSRHDKAELDSESRDDETLWKDFILGERGSNDVDSSEQEHSIWATEQDETVRPAFQSTSSRFGTDQARSDKVTVGNSVFVPSFTDDEVDNSPEANEEYQKYAATSMLGHATTADFEDDEIEEIDDVYPDDSVSRTMENINVARNTSTPNPERFKCQKSQASSKEPYNPRRFKVCAVERSAW